MWPPRSQAAASSTTDRLDHISTTSQYQITTAGLTTPSLIVIKSTLEVALVPGLGNVRIGARSEVAATNAVSDLFLGSLHALAGSLKSERR